MNNKLWEIVIKGFIKILLMILSLLGIKKIIDNNYSFSMKRGKTSVSLSKDEKEKK